MIREPADALLTLLQRARSSLWLWRSRQTLWYGVCVGALVFLWAGLWHVLHAPVALHLGLSLALVGPALAVCYAFLWQRPDHAAAAAALDRRGNHQDIFVSSWEAHCMPPSQRCAGAVALLQRVTTLAPEITIPSEWSASQRWYSHFSFLPWTVLLSGLFLLQLPAAQEPPNQRIAATAAGNDPQGEYPRRQTPGAGVSASRNSVMQAGQSDRGRPAAAQLQSRQPPPGNAVAPGDELTAALQQENSAAAQAMPARSSGSPATGKGQDVAAGNQTHARGAGIGRDDPVTVTSGQHDPRFDAAVEFVDIARREPGATAYPAARGDSVELTGPDTVADAKGVDSTGPAVTRPGAPPYGGRFSLRQRQQIANYFEKIQELP